MRRRIDFRDLDEPRNNNSPTGRIQHHEPRSPHAPRAPSHSPGRRSGGGVWIIAIALAIGLIFYFASSRNEDNPSREQQTTPKSPPATLFERVWKNDSSIQCKYLPGVSPLYIYASDKQNERNLRIDITTDFGARERHYIIKSEVAYWWDRGGGHTGDYGHKKFIDDIAIEKFFDEYYQEDYKSGSLTCERWMPDDSLFELPSHVNFIGVTGSPEPQSSDARGSASRPSGLPAALLPKLTIGPWTINGTVASAFVGQWSGTVIQTGSVSDQYPVVITIRSGQSNQRLGAVNYPTLGCSGELILSAASSAQIIVEESLTKGLSACVNHTKVTLTLNEDGTLRYSARVSTVSGSAVLRPESPSSEKKTVVYPPSQVWDEVLKRRQQFRDEAFKRRQQFRDEAFKRR